VAVNFGVWVEPLPDDPHGRVAGWAIARESSPLYAVHGGPSGYKVVEKATGRIAAACPTSEAAFAAWRLLHAGVFRVRMSAKEAEERASELAKFFPELRYTTKPLSGPATPSEIILGDRESP